MAGAWTGSSEPADAIHFGDSQRHTVRRVLREMDDCNWLTRKNNRSTT
jgi:hypothetical protein